jgi:hypothetical protein
MREDRMEVNCEVCGVRTTVSVFRSEYNDRDWIREMPDGWLVADTFPPGDSGLQFVCSLSCALKQSNLEREGD